MSSLTLSSSAANNDDSSSHSNNNNNNVWSTRFVVKFMAIPYLIGYILSSQNLELMERLFSPLIANNQNGGGLFSSRRSGTSSKDDDDQNEFKFANRALLTSDDVEACYRDLIHSMYRRPRAIIQQQQQQTMLQQQQQQQQTSDDGSSDGDGDDESTQSSQSQQQQYDDEENNNPFHGLSIVLHRNGETEPCGTVGSSSTTTTTTTSSSTTTTTTKTSTTEIDLMTAFKNTISVMTTCPDFTVKFHFDSFFTRVLHSTLLANACASTATSTSNTTTTEGGDGGDDEDSNNNEDDEDGGFYSYCYAGKLKTPVLPDQKQLIPITLDDDDDDNNNKNNNKNTDNKDDDSEKPKYYPCHFHNQHGQRITSMWALAANALRAETDTTSTDTDATTSNNDEAEAQDSDETSSTESNTTTTSDSQKKKYRKRKLILTAVPVGRHYMFAPSYIGQIFTIPHVKGANPQLPVYLEVLSVVPRIFDVHNLFLPQDGYTIVNEAIAETREEYRLTKSASPRRGYPRVTSEGGFVTSSDVAMSIKRRGFYIAGFDDFLDSQADGLQVLRYNRSKACDNHLDYIPWTRGDEEVETNYDSAGVGGNRFATFLLYFNNMTGKEDGGQTVFPEAQTKEDRIPFKTALRQLRDSGDASHFREDSWKEFMVANCRSRFSIDPREGRAILLYSQYPNGEKDPTSIHGGCPVLNGTKYAANYWIWSAPRDGTPGCPKNPHFKGTPHEARGAGSKKLAKFHNTGKDPAYARAELYIGDEFWSKLGPRDPPVSVNTFQGHVWKLKVEGITVITWTIGKEEKYSFSI